MSMSIPVFFRPGPSTGTRRTRPDKPERHGGNAVDFPPFPSAVRRAATTTTALAPPSPPPGGSRAGQKRSPTACRTRSTLDRGSVVRLRQSLAATGDWAHARMYVENGRTTRARSRSRPSLGTTFRSTRDRVQALFSRAFPTRESSSGDVGLRPNPAFPHRKTLAPARLWRARSCMTLALTRQ